MKRMVAWLALEVDDAANAKMIELLLRGACDDLKTRGFITDYGVLVKEVKDGERPSPIPPDGLLPKMGKA